jgi:hypothetical protein
MREAEDDRASGGEAPDDATVVRDMEDATFKKLVDDDMRDARLPEERRRVPKSLSKVLRHPEVAPRWLDALVTTAHSIHDQLGAANAEIAALELEAQLDESRQQEFKKAAVQHERWKVGVLRFKASLDMTMVEARRAVRSANDEGLLTRLRQRNNALYQLVTAHLDVCPLNDDLRKQLQAVLAS